MAITTKALLHEYVLRELGQPLVQVELATEHIDDSINDSIKLFSEFAFDGEMEETVIIEVDGNNSYSLPVEITSIIKVSQGGTSSIGNFGAMYGAGFVPNIWSETFFTGDVSGIMNSVIGISSTRAQLDKFFGDDLAYDFNAYKKKLRIFEPYTGPLLVHYTKEYIPEAIDYIFDATWVKKYSVALSRMKQSTVTGKYQQTLVGGAMINHENMRALAEQEIQTLKEDLQLQYSGPAPIFIG